LYKSGKWTSLDCTACATTKSSRQWLCVCGTPWIGCAIHSASGFLCVSPARTATKRKLNCLTPTENYTSNSRSDIALLGSANQGVFKRKRTPRKHEFPNDLKRAQSGSSVLTNHSAQSSKRVRFTGSTSLHQNTKRAPHLLQADAVASIKRMRSAEPLPLSAFLPSHIRIDNAEFVNADLSSMSADSDLSASDHSAPFVHPVHTQTGAAVFSSTAASSHSSVQIVSSARSQSSPVTISSDIYNG
jgi:hypothetical protein